MKNFWVFVKKEFYHIIRDTKTLAILIGMPIAQILLFGFAITNDIKDAYVSFYDPTPNHLTQEIKNKLLASGYFNLDEELNSPNEFDRLFRKGKSKLIISFEPDFVNQLHHNKKSEISIIADATDPNTANILTNYAKAILKEHQMSAYPNLEMPYQINASVTMLYNPTMKSVYMFVPGVITIILMLISAMMTSISIAREKELGTMEVMLVSPMKPVQMIISKTIPYLIISLINAVTVLLLGYFVFNMPFTGSISLLAFETILFAFTSLALGILISTIAKTMQTAMMVSMVGLMMPTILLSGFIFPIENMPVVLQVLSNVFPAKWFIIIIKGVLLKGVGLDVLWKETLILTGMTLFFILVSTKKFKIRLA